MPLHIYKNAKGNRIPGVTTVIGGNLGWNKQQLMWWAWNEGINGRQFRETSQHAADIGTIAHAMVEHELKGTDWRVAVDLRTVTDEMVEKAMNAYKAWKEWAQLVDFKLMKSEVSLVSERYQFGGTIDLALVKNRSTITDIKTSNGVYPDHKIQIAAYGVLWNENFPDEQVNDYYLLRLDKKDGGFAYYYWPDMSDAWRAFEYLLGLHGLKKQIA